MRKKEKFNKNTIPEGFSLGLAVYDALPVLFFGISVLLLGTALRSPLFVAGAALCFWAGAAKVVWKIIVATKRKNIWWLFLQMRICMPIGFVLMFAGGIACRGQQAAAQLWQLAGCFPVSLLLGIGLLGLVLMGVAAAKLDSADVKANLLEQTINTIAQLSILLGVVLLSFFGDYSEADATALAALQSTDAVTVTVSAHQVLFTPADAEPDTGLIFYPGAKVEYTAYAPLLQEIAGEGVTCVLVEMPLNFAVFGFNAAADVIAGHPEIQNWYLAGHSFGGVFGSYYAAKHPEELSGVILLGSYSVKPLAGLSVLSVHGSEDGVIRAAQFEKYQANLPEDFTELFIQGGNHAMFGSYGAQAGDKPGIITPEEQWRITAEAVMEFIGGE